MSPCYPFRPIPGQCGPHRRGPLPAPPFDPQDYWATRKLVNSLFGSLDTTKLDKADVVDPITATEDGKAADAKSTYEELTRISGMASDAKELAESKADQFALEAHVASTNNPHSVTAEQVNAYTKETVDAKLDEKADIVGGKIPASQLPSYVDDVLEYDTMSAFPVTGEGGKIYVAKDTNLTYRWSGTQYVEISPSPLLDDTVTEKSPNGVKSSGIWSWVKSLLPSWLTSDYVEPATVASVKLKADKATTLAGYGITDAVPFVDDVNGEKTAVTIGSRRSGESVGVHSFANGDGVAASFDGSHAEGGGTSAYGIYSHAEGITTTASGDGSHSEGNGTTASGPNSHAEGAGTTAAGSGSHAEGTGTTASEDYSHAEGTGTTASGYGSHAEGDYTTASGSHSHAEGTGTTALGDYSHTDGIRSQTLSGHYYAYAWNGDEDIQYSSHDKGTFNINPKDGLNGFFIGERKFSEILSDKSDCASLAPEYSPTSAYAVGAIVYHDGNIYQCKTAIADGGEAFNAEHWELRELEDFFTESNSLLTGTIATKSIPSFSSSSTYEVGEIVVYDGVAYKCVTAITTAEEWTAAHWTLATNSDLAARLKGLKSDGTATDAFVTDLLGKQVAKEAIDEEIIDKGTAPDAHLEAPTDERLKLILADNSVAYDSAKALPYKLTSVIGDRVIATMTLTAASTDITLPTIAANDTTVKDFILDVTNAYAVEGAATDAGINIPRTDFKLVTRDGESLTDVTTVKAGKSAFLCFTQKAPVVVDGTTYPCWCVTQLPFGDPS